MIAMDETRMRGPLPRKIYLYFMHGNTLDYRKEAFLYANLLTYSDDQAMFLNYREQIDDIYMGAAHETPYYRGIEDSL